MKSTTSRNADCQIGEIKKKRSYSSLDDALNAGFDPCDYCLPRTLRAHPFATPSSVTRGDKVTLDGKKHSRPRRGEWKITDWLWTITTADQPSKTITSTNPVLSFTVLGDFTATLQVKNKEATSQKTITVKCTPRKWRKVAWQAANTGGAINTGLVSNALGLGINLCTYEAATGAMSSGHAIHRTSDRGTWKTDDTNNPSGYTTKKVADGGSIPGPWEGCFYLEKHTLRICRTECRSTDLFPTSDLWKANVAAGYESAITLVAGAVQAHEGLHSTIPRETNEQAGRGPIDTIEKLVNTDAPGAEARSRDDSDVAKSCGALRLPAWSALRLVWACSGDEPRAGATPAVTARFWRASPVWALRAQIKSTIPLKRYSDPLHSSLSRVIREQQHIHYADIHASCVEMR